MSLLLPSHIVALLASYVGEDQEKAEAALLTLESLASTFTETGQKEIEISPTPFQFPSPGYQILSHSSPSINEGVIPNGGEGHFPNAEVMRKSSLAHEVSVDSSHKTKTGSHSPTRVQSPTRELHESKKKATSGVKDSSARHVKSKHQQQQKQKQQQQQLDMQRDRSRSASPALSNMSVMSQPLGRVGKIKLYMTDLQRGEGNAHYCFTAEYSHHFSMRSTGSAPSISMSTAGHWCNHHCGVGFIVYLIKLQQVT